MSADALDALAEAEKRNKAEVRQIYDALMERNQEVATLEQESVNWRQKAGHLEQERDAEKARADALGQQLEADRTTVADCITKANRAIDSRHWLTEGRGSFEWNDDKWHDEFRAAAMEIKSSLEPLAKIAADWTGCPRTSAEVAAARINWKARADEARKDQVWWETEARKQLARADQLQKALNTEVIFCRAERERAEKAELALAAIAKRLEITPDSDILLLLDVRLRHYERAAIRATRDIEQLAEQAAVIATLRTRLDRAADSTGLVVESTERAK